MNGGARCIDRLIHELAKALTKEGNQGLLPVKEANALLKTSTLGSGRKNEEDLRQLVLRLQDLIPFEFALCAFSGTSYSSAEPYRIVNVSYPVAWLELYIAEQFDRVDPITRGASPPLRSSVLGRLL